MNEERRRYPRIREEDGIAVRILSPNGAEEDITILRMTKDISKFGLRFQTERYLPVDTQIKIYMALKSPRKTITHFARVVWIRKLSDEDPYSIGVEITDASEADMEVWEQYINERLGSLDMN